MSISRQPGRRDQRPLRMLAFEAVGLAGALAFLPEVVGARAGAVLEPHPGWIAVLLLAARYGSGGFFAGLGACAVAVGIGSTVAGTGLMTRWSRLDSGPNLIAFGACLAVSWIASWHLQRQAGLDERYRGISDRASQAQETIETLRGVVATLRARVDRSLTSLSFLRDVAASLEGTDPTAAAEGAADLALARTGASAAAVKVGVGTFQRLLAVRDARGPKDLTPLALQSADLTVSIRNGNDRVGVIALWGIPPSALDKAAANDLEIIASWCARALTVSTRRPNEPAAPAGRAV